MSLINQMLQDLDARRAETAGAAPYGEQVRAVPERRSVHPAWWLVLALAVVLAGVLAWLLLRPPVPAAAARPESPPRLPLKFDTDLDVRTTRALPSSANASSQPTAAMPAPPGNAAENPPEAATPAVPAQPTDAERAITPYTPSVEKQAKDKRTVTTQPSQDVQPAALPDAATVVPATRSLVAAPQAKAVKPPSPVTADKHIKEFTPQQRAENEYRKAILLLQQGKTAETISGLESALQLDPQHAGARQALIGVLLENKRSDDAMRVAREGLELDLRQPGLAMILARLQLEKGELHPAIETLEHTLPYGAERADYQAFLAALLQRDDKHKQAIEHYLQALQRAPQSGVWWMGLGISLQADHRLAEAQEAFKRAKASNTLSAELLAFVDARLRQLQH